MEPEVKGQQAQRGTPAPTLKQFWSEAKYISELTNADDAEIRRFFDSVGMSDGGFTLLMKRNPSYFELLRHRGGFSTVSGLRDKSGKLVGTGTMTSTPSFVGGLPANTVYLCDLRVDCPDREVAKTWKEGLGRMLREGAGLHGHGDNPYMITVIIEGNERARKLLEEKSHGGKKLFSLAKYSMITLFFRKPFFHLKKTKFKVENNPSVEETEAFLHAVHSKQAFGARFDAPFFELRRRLKTWKGFSMKDFYIVRNEEGQIMASTALWNPSHCKQTVIMGPLWTKPYNWIARVFNFPEFGKPVEIIYLTHLSFSWNLSEEKKLQAFRELLIAIWPEKRRRKAHGLAFCDFKEYSIASAADEFFVARVPIKMYLVVPETDADSFDRKSLGKFPPAFEMALV